MWIFMGLQRKASVKNSSIVFVIRVKSLAGTDGEWQLLFDIT